MIRIIKIYIRVKFVNQKIKNFSIGFNSNIIKIVSAAGTYQYIYILNYIMVYVKVRENIAAVINAFFYQKVLEGLH